MKGKRRLAASEALVLQRHRCSEETNPGGSKNDTQTISTQSKARVKKHLLRQADARGPAWQPCAARSGGYLGVEGALPPSSSAALSVASVPERGRVAVGETLSRVMVTYSRVGSVGNRDSAAGVTLLEVAGRCLSMTTYSRPPVVGSPPSLVSLSGRAAGRCLSMVVYSRSPGEGSASLPSLPSWAGL